MEEFSVWLSENLKGDPGGLFYDFTRLLNERYIRFGEATARLEREAGKVEVVGIPIYRMKPILQDLKAFILKFVLFLPLFTSMIASGRTLHIKLF
jgi:hypothetical protein